MNGFFQRKSTIFFILIFAFILRVLLLIGIILKNPDGIYVFDSYGYWQINYNIINFSTFSQSYELPLVPDYFRTPLYPLFIVLAEQLGPEGFSIIVLQFILAVLTCYFTYRIAISLSGNIFIGNVAALLVAVDLPSIVLSNLVLTETLFTFLLVICFYFFIVYLKQEKINHLILTGIFSGLLILCRPVAFFIPFLFTGFIFFRQRKIIRSLVKQVSLLLILTFIVISPWLIRNKIVYQHYFLSVIREHNLLNYQAATVYAERFNYPLPKAQSILRWKTFREFEGDANKQPYEYAEHIEKEGKNILLTYPGIFLKQQIKGCVYFFLKPTRAYIDIQLGHWGKGYNSIPKNYPIVKYLFEHSSRLTIVLVYVQLFILLLIYLAFIPGLIYIKKNTETIYPALLLLTVFIFANFNLSEITEARFRVPVWPLISVIGSFGIFYAKELISRRKTASLL